MQVCQRLRADEQRNGNYPDQPTVSYLMAHAASLTLDSDLATVLGDMPAVSYPAAFWAGMPPITRVCTVAGVSVADPSF